MKKNDQNNEIMNTIIYILVPYKVRLAKNSIALTTF